MKPPSYDEVRVTYLKKKLEHTRTILREHDETRAKYGCSLMVDGWSDRKQRRLINFVVNGLKGTKFIEYVDGSSYVHTGAKMFDLLDKYVQLVGDKDVIQVVTDSASAKVLAGSFLESKYPHLYWSPCAAHCIDLMFHDIFKLPNLKKTYERSVMINAYIYNRPLLLDIMRDFTKHREMVRPTKTRFATAFLTLKRFHVQKGNLKKMFTSEKWTSSYAKEAQGKLVASIMLMPSFWNYVLFIVKVAGPLVKVLQLVDGEKKPPMGYIYEVMDRAKEAIAASFSNNEEKYKEIFEMIDKRGISNFIGHYMQLGSWFQVLNYMIRLLMSFQNSILLDEIDESNEWLLGRLTLDDSDEENVNVFEDDDLTWGDVAQAAGADEDAYDFQSRPLQESKGKSKASSSKATKKVTTSSRSTGHRHLIDEEAEEENEEEHFDDIDEEEADYIFDDDGDDGEGSEDDLA
ncbi:hypothetical protein Salat_1903300 [Sesamum alatum]|uniref:DUF659 domain-containing protein n=1 Tax=Sesamum alatum TaxID=300844 RepID=A0AAE1Y3Q7_9LAMI|nr:hypothetical protein Salat_1903300 [Sesamum alatum]